VESRQRHPVGVEEILRRGLARTLQLAALSAQEARVMLVEAPADRAARERLERLDLGVPDELVGARAGATWMALMSRSLSGDGKP
jgi:hypothetical protein